MDTWILFLFVLGGVILYVSLKTGNHTNKVFLTGSSFLFFVAVIIKPVMEEKVVSGWMIWAAISLATVSLVRILIILTFIKEK